MNGNRLPVELNSFIGRKNELFAIKQKLLANRLVTVTGVAGCGKTRIARRLAAELSENYDGVYWIGLAPLANGELLSQTIAKSLNISEDKSLSPLDNIVEALRDAHILLVLDNCEHLVAECTELIRTLLLETSVNLLITSREALQIAGEIVFPLKPMKVPPSNVRLNEIAQFDAVGLFVERARAIVPDFALTDDNALVVASICQKLDGVPLAIELASARVNVLSLEQIANRLDYRFGLLSTPAVSSLGPHQTLRAAIDWSYDLLTVPEQMMLQQLSVFKGGCSLRTAVLVCASDRMGDEQVIGLLTSLVNKSLVVAQTLGVDEARYSLLEIIRQYGQEKLIASSDWELVHHRHHQTFLELTEHAEKELEGEKQQFWLDWFEREFDNIRAALTWALEHNHIETGLRIANANYQYWTIRDYSAEGLSWYERLLAKIDEGVDPVIHAMSLCYAANMSGFRGDISRQIKYGRKATAVAETAGAVGKHALAWALAAQAYGARAEGDFETEFELARRAIQLHRESDNKYLLALSLSIWSFSAMSIGEYQEAHNMLDEALPMLREMGNPYRIAMALNFSGDLARCEKNYRQAEVIYKESLSILREINALRDLASVLHNLGHVYLHQDQIETAANLFTESMITHKEQGNKAGMAECLIGFAALAIKNEDAAIAVRLLSATIAIRGQRVTALWAATRMDYEYYLDEAKADLSVDEFKAAQVVGRTLSLEQAIDYAEKIADQILSPQPEHNDLDALTDRELEVVILIAHAKSNGEIADELFLSKRTVEKHIANIRSKLRFTKRTQIVRWAIDKGLLESGN